MTKMAEEMKSLVQIQTNSCTLEEEEECNKMNYFDQNTNEIETIINIVIQDSLTNVLSNEQFINTQNIITSKIRYVIVEWLIRVVQTIPFNRSTLFNAVSLLDHYLSESPATRENIQLIAATSLWISAKIEEIEKSDIRYFVSICRNKFIADQFKQMEINFIQIIGSQLNYPTSIFFVDFFLRMTEQNSLKFRIIVQMLLDSSLTRFNFNEYNPSLIAVSAIYATFLILKIKCPLVKLSNKIRSNVSLIKHVGYLLFDTCFKIMNQKSSGIYTEYTTSLPDWEELFHEAQSSFNSLLEQK